MLDLGKCGTLREIGMTDIRDILLFMVEYPKYKAEPQEEKRQMFYADEVDWL